MKQQTIQRPQTLDLTLVKDFCMNTHKLIQAKNLDWVSVISGREGQGGKSTLAIIRALWVNPDFDPDTQVIYDLESFLNYLDVNENNPGKVALFDEAILMFLGSEANTWEARRFQKMFVTHRDLNQEYYLCSPSPWRLLPYLREDRVNDFLLGYIDPGTKNFDRRVSYYNRFDYVKFITNTRAKKDVLVPSHFVIKHKPTVDVPYILPRSTRMEEVYDRIFELKKDAQRNLRQETREQMVKRQETDVQRTKNPVKTYLYPVAEILHTEEHYTVKDSCRIANMSPDMFYKIRRELFSGK